MFLKVFKYDFISVFRKYIPMLIIVGGLSLVARLVNSIIDPTVTNIVASFLIGSVNTIFIFSLIATIVYSSILVIIRYVRSLYRDQGYLTHTLPVSKHQLLLSQLLVSVLMTLISVAVILVGVFIAYFTTNWIDGIRAFFESFFDMTLPNIGEVILSIFTVIMGALQSIFVIYFGISLGHAMNKNKTLLSVIFCIALNNGIGIFFSILQLLFYNVITSFNGILIFYLITSTIICVACYFLTIFMMKKHLNLE